MGPWLRRPCWLASASFDQPLRIDHPGARPPFGGVSKPTFSTPGRGGHPGLERKMNSVVNTVVKNRPFWEGYQNLHFRPPEGGSPGLERKMNSVVNTVAKNRPFLEGYQNHHFRPPEGGSSRIGKKNEFRSKHCSKESTLFGGVSKPPFSTPGKGFCPRSIPER